MRDVFSIFGMNGDLPSLDLAVVTHRPEGIRRVARMVLPPIDGVNYVVSWQDSGDTPIPESLKRSDVRIYRLEGQGISRNRNNAIANCHSDIVLFADDDIIYCDDSFRQVREAFILHPEIDVATFRSEHGDMSRFPAVETRLERKFPAGYYVNSIEIAFRRKLHLCCCEELGIGAPVLHGGEDEVFLLSAVRRGLECRFFPITICAHPHESTGTKARMTSGNLMAAGCVIMLTYPWSAWWRVPLKAWRVWRARRAGFADAFGNIIRGAMMARGVRRRNRDSLW